MWAVFWFYIVDQEEKVFKKHFSQIKMISDLICSNIELDLEPYYDYIEKEHRNYNNQVPWIFFPTDALTDFTK